MASAKSHRTSARPASAPAPDDGVPLLEVENLHVRFETKRENVLAVNGISFRIDTGEQVALLGESGSGKSVTAEAILGLLDSPPAVIEADSISFEGRQLLGMSERGMRAVRGQDIAMVFQDSMAGLNPVHRVGDQIVEAIRARSKVSPKAARARAIELLRLVQIPGPASRIDSFPHEFSGGMRQRAMIAIAIAQEPQLLIADEPTTALDVTIQAQIIELLAALARDLDMALLLITHDMGVVAQVVDRLYVMYAGQIVEQGGVGEIFTNPSHPYTGGLLQSVPRSDRRADSLSPIPGQPPTLTALHGCSFRDRCRYDIEICHEEVPRLREAGSDNHLAACHRIEHYVAQRELALS